MDAGLLRRGAGWQGRRVLHRLLARTGAGWAAFAQFLPLFLRQFLVLTPALVQLVMLFRRKLFHAFVPLDCLSPLLGRQRNPFMHALLDALLPVRWQGGITRGEADPVFASFGVELVPFRLERSEDGFLFGRQLRPRGAGCLGMGGTRNRNYADEQGERQYYCCGCA